MRIAAHQLNAKSASYFSQGQSRAEAWAALIGHFPQVLPSDYLLPDAQQHSKPWSKISKIKASEHK